MRHLRVLIKAWSAENREGRSRATHSQHDFLPAALEATETPPSPIGRLILWLIIIAAMIALIWSCVAKVDEVAIAEGRLVPSGRLRSLEASEQGVITSINVKEGQHVAAGQLLIELNPIQEIADANAAEAEVVTAALTRARDDALISHVQGRRRSFVVPDGASEEAIAAEQALVAARISEYQSKLASLRERRAGAEAGAAAIRAEIRKIELTLPLLREQYNSQRQLALEGFGSRQKLLATQQSVISAEQELVSQRAKEVEATAQTRSIAAELSQTTHQFVGNAAMEKAEAEGSLIGRQEVVKKANERKARMSLLAPVSGLVQEVSVTTIGQTTEVGKPIVTIVPDGEKLIVEGLLLNRDVGFVHPGQAVTIKLEAFPFTRYGVVKGTVEYVSPDAAVDENRGLVFPIRVKILSYELSEKGQRVALTAGMAATLEVVTRKRRVIDYLWSPVARKVSEAGRER